MPDTMTMQMQRIKTVHSRYTDAILSVVTTEYEFCIKCIGLCLTCAIQGGPKSKPVSNYQKVVLKPANEIRLFRKFEEMIKHYNIIRQY